MSILQRGRGIHGYSELELNLGCYSFSVYIIIENGIQLTIIVTLQYFKEWLATGPVFRVRN